MPLATRVRDANAEAIQAPVPVGHGRAIAEINQNTVSSIWGMAKSHITTDKEGWRIDRQNPTTDGCANIQVQRNGVVGKKSTIACVLVPTGYNVGKPVTTADKAAKATLEHNARMSELAKAVRDGLTQSAASYVAGQTGKPGRISNYEVHGEFSAKMT